MEGGTWEGGREEGARGIRTSHILQSRSEGPACCSLKPCALLH